MAEEEAPVSAGMTGMLHPSLAPLLRAVQEARVYDDSKAAVDLVLRRDPEEVARLAAAALPGLLLPPPASAASSSPPSVSREALAAFLSEHCDPPGSDLEPHTPEDWRPDPPRLARLGPRPAAADLALLPLPLPSPLPLPPLLTDAERAAVHELARTAVHGRWRVLCRRWKGAQSAAAPAADGPRSRLEAKRLALRSSLLPLPEPQMVPGDRFREAYYWDSYWVVRGLLASGMLDTAAGTVRNLVAMADAAAAAAAEAGGGGGGGGGSGGSSSLPGGHVPNGARCYYLNRSQPPLLAPMARAVAEALLSRGGGGGGGGGEAGGAASDASAAAAADDLLRRALPAIERELAHWRAGPKQVLCVGPSSGGGISGFTHQHSLARYWAQWEGPRPESQREDEATAQEALVAAPAGGAEGATAPAAVAAANDAEADRLRRRLMRDLASAAESGWDFSTRWMPPPPLAAGGRLWKEAGDGGGGSGGGGSGISGPAPNPPSSQPLPPPPPTSLSSLRTTRVVPADLNALLYRAERDAAWAAMRLGDAERAVRLEALAQMRARAMRALLWDERAACWRDGWMVRRWRLGGDAEAADDDEDAGGGAFPPLEEEEEEEQEDEDEEQRLWVVRRSPGVYASNYIPLWCGVLDDGVLVKRGAAGGDGKASIAATADRVALSLLASGLLRPGGVAASLYASGQQWDWPNAWPPLQHALAEACAKEEEEEEEEGDGGRRRSPAARAVGLAVAAAYARAVLQGWEGGGGELHEKYDARGGGREGRGGEYAPQVGFGWTNGALLALVADGLI